MTALALLALVTAAGCVTAAWYAGYLSGRRAGMHTAALEQLAARNALARLTEETLAMPPRACTQWTQAAQRGRARVSTGSGRLVVVDGRGARLVSHCPWCGAKLRYVVAGSEILTPSGKAHAEASRAAESEPRR